MSAPGERTPNRLQGEKSPYLLQHAFNPVRWFPWGDDAFQTARRESKPIFLSIGYATCHWCHVMEKESFENDAIAALLNEFFVAVKVDREERPDVDRVYMTALQAMGQNGGWPMSMFLTPDLRPFYGGTYFPPESRFGRAGFPDVLRRIHDIWTLERAKAEEAASGITGFLNDAADAPGGAEPADGSVDTLCYQQISSSYDAARGGFGGGPKFPRPVVLDFLFGYHGRKGEPAALAMAAHTLRAMASGGMNDQIGGGFHRYSVDAEWRVPHFEKMLYDQAQLSASYLAGYALTGDPLFARVARETFDYVLRDLSDAEGGFHSAEDADSEKPGTDGEMGEGAFYVWSARELRNLLGKEYALFSLVYGVEEDGNVPADPHHEFTGQNILFLARPPAEVAGRIGRPQDGAVETLAGTKALLFEARTGRRRPLKDDKVLTAWNGLMIGALARGWRILGEPRYGDAARRSARFLAARMRAGGTGRLLRRFRQGDAGVEAQLSDYAFLVSGLIDLYEASGEGEWLSLAVLLTETQIALFHDGTNGGFFDTPGDDPSLLVRMKETYDGAEPAGNSVSAINLLRLSVITGREEWRALAAGTIGRAAHVLRAQPVAAPLMASASAMLASPWRQIVIAGTPGDSVREEMINLAFRHYHWATAVIHSTAPRAGASAPSVNPSVGSYIPLNGKATAYVCRDFRCDLPVTDAAALALLLRPEMKPDRRDARPDASESDSE